jgi:hypothetical protein
MVLREMHSRLPSRIDKNGAQPSARCERLSQAMNGRFLCFAPIFSASPQNSCRFHLIYYLGELTAESKLKPEYIHVRNVARVRTITVLTQLNARRISYVFAFLRVICHDTCPLS